jgi:hypothetical protein
VGLLDLVTAPLRSATRAASSAEQDVERHSPVAETHALEAKLEETIETIARAAEALERQVEVVDRLSDSLPALTELVTQVTQQLNELLKMMAPAAAAEREVGRLEHLFRRRPASDEPTS